MHVKVTRSGPRRYVQLVESFRDDDGRVRKRTVASLGRLDQVGGSLDAVINGLLKATGRSPALAKDGAPDIQFESAKTLGSVWALHGLWQTLGFGELRRVFRRSRRRTCGAGRPEAQQRDATFPVVVERFSAHSS